MKTGNIRATKSLRVDADPVDDSGVGNRGYTDVRYYTESQVDTISGTLQTDIDTRAVSGGAEHDNFSDFVANEHIDHSGISITAGIGLTGGGDITQNRTLDVNVGITDDKIVQIDDLDAADNDYCKLTASGVEGRNYSEVLGDLSESGQFALGEYGIKLDSLLSADGKYSGITCDGVLGATLAFGDLVCLNTTDQRWELADADAEATAGDVQLAIVTTSGVDGDTRLLLLQGFIRENGWNFTSYGKSLYVSTTAGDMTQTVVSGTGDIVRVVGYASTFADQIYFNPSGSWIEII